MAPGDFLRDSRASLKRAAKFNLCRTLQVFDPLHYPGGFTCNHRFRRSNRFPWIKRGGYFEGVASKVGEEGRGKISHDLKPAAAFEIENTFT